LITRPLLYAKIRFAGIPQKRSTPGIRFHLFVWLFDFDRQECEGGPLPWTRYKSLVLSRYHIIQTIYLVLAEEAPLAGPLFCTVDRQAMSPVIFVSNLALLLNRERGATPH